jgi:hypothetical protein
MIPSPLAQPYFNGRPRNDVPRNEGPQYEPPPTQTSRIEERESLETLKLLMNMNNQILSLNRKVNDMQFFSVPRPRTPFPPTPPPRQHAAEVDWCHFFQDFHDPEYFYSYTRHMELSKNGKSPLPPVKKKLASTSQNDQVNMEQSIPYDDDPFAFGSFVVETRSQAPKTTPQGVEEAKSDPKDNEKGKLPVSGRLPSPTRNRVPWTPNKVNLPNKPPPCFPTLIPYNVVEYLAKVPTHMKLLDALRTPAQFENLSCVLQAPLTPIMKHRLPLSKESSSQPREAYDVIDLDHGVPPFYISVLIFDFVLHC